MYYLQRCPGHNIIIPHKLQDASTRLYLGRLREVGMTTLQARRERVDMITTFRIMEGHDRVDRGTWFKTLQESRDAGVRRRQDTAAQLVKEPLGLEVRKQSES